MQKHDESKSLTGWASFKQAMFYGLLILFALVFAVYMWSCFSIRSSVKQIGAMAVEQYPGDRIDALIKYVESQDHPLRQRDRAVWALGQIGDERALPTLQKYYTGGPCDHTSQLCQHELEKAVKLCSGSFNATAWLPR